ncbi:MAG TPA: FAD-binding oxidoreductase [Gemmatimonadales bacterium]|nr:FAD-binding oxidoreductase [Gemmatimonadales bacterium]
MSDATYVRLMNLLGPEGIERDGHGLPRAVPESDDALALVCQIAQQEGWRFRLEGLGSWVPPDGPADFALSTRGLDRIVQVSPADLVATVQSGVRLEALRAELQRHGLWLALDPPGRPDRTIGSVVATGTAGPLRHGYGPVRDHILGCTVATGDGRLVSAGGRVVKNVAGYDLTKLQVGGFGGFGVLTELHLRLRASPPMDLTLVATGGRHALIGAAHDAVEAQVGVVALELLSPALAALPEWALAARIVGTSDGSQADAAQLARITGLKWERYGTERAASFWSLVARAALDGPVAIRLGALVDGLPDLTDLVIDTLGEELLSAGIGSGMLRWSGAADTESLRRLRRRAAERETPLTLERAPWPCRRAVGHFGAYREGVGTLVGRLRTTFDPKGTIAVALEGRDD